MLNVGAVIVYLFSTHLSCLIRKNFEKFLKKVPLARLNLLPKND